MTESSKQIAVLMGSDSDFHIMKEAVIMLKRFRVPCDVFVTSAHRTPERTSAYVKSARDNGIRAIIVGAGAAAHLAGVVASETTLPVIAVPIDATSLNGLDALLSTVQMPGGIPVATMAIGQAGAKNAALFAVEILALHDDGLKSQLDAYRSEFKESVAEKSASIRKQVDQLLNE